MLPRKLFLNDQWVFGSYKICSGHQWQANLRNINCLNFILLHSFAQVSDWNVKITVFYLIGIIKTLYLNYCSKSYLLRSNCNNRLNCINDGLIKVQMCKAPNKLSKEIYYR